MFGTSRFYARENTKEKIMSKVRPITELHLNDLKEVAVPSLTGVTFEFAEAAYDLKVLGYTMVRSQPQIAVTYETLSASRAGGNFVLNKFNDRAYFVINLGRQEKSQAVHVIVYMDGKLAVE
jgi:hypothetical protein